MLLFVYGGLFFFSFIYILSLFRRIQTIWRQQGWRSCSKLCRVCAAFLDSTSFFKYNPCHFFNIIPCQPWVSVPSLVSCWAVLFGRSQAESALTFHAEEPQHWAQWRELEFLKVPSLLCSMCLLRLSFLFHFLILGKCHLYTSFQEQVQCHAEKNGNFERQKYVSVSAFSRGFHSRGKFPWNAKRKLHKLGSFYCNSKLLS